MRYEIRYDLDNLPASDERALQDCINWLGSEEKADEIAGALAWDDSITTMQQLRLALSFVGILGFPVESLARAFRPDLTED